MSQNKSLKFGILGAGSIGCYIGANLQNGGHDVVFAGRDKLRMEIKEYGFTITDLETKNFRLPPETIRYSATPEILNHCDVILVTVKSQGTKEAITTIKNIIRPDAVLVSFQNGVSNAGSIREILPDRTVLAGMVPYNVVQIGNGKFHSGTSGDLVIEKRLGVSENIVQALIDSGLAAKEHPDLPGILWGKLILNLNNAINALAGVPLKEELSNVAYRKILAETQREALRLLKRAGIKPRRSGKMIPQIAPFVLGLSDFLFFRIASTMIQIDPLARSSMWEDLNKGRETEIDYINGEIISLAKSLNAQAPINSKIVELIKVVEKSRSGSPGLSAARLASSLEIDI